MNRKAIHALLILLILAIGVSTTAIQLLDNKLVAYAGPLQITLEKDKETYNLGEEVNIKGNLTYNGQPLNTGLVAVQIDDPNNNRFIFRTRPTGSSTPPLAVEIVDVYPCDYYGNPKYSFKRGESAYINITYRNNSPLSSKHVAIAFSVYYAEKTPFYASVPLIGDINPNATDWVRTPAIDIPANAPFCNATAYVSLFTDLPKNGGWPYCFEKSAIFMITNTVIKTPTGHPFSPTYSEGAYNLTFRMPTNDTNPDIVLGNYTIYVAASYGGYLENSTTTFKVVYAPPPLSVTIDPYYPTRTSIDRTVEFVSAASGGTPPYSYQWYLNGTTVSGANSTRWNFTSSVIGLYIIHVSVTDNTALKVNSSKTPVTVTLIPTYILTITVTPYGTTNPTPGSYLYENGTLVSVTAIPDSGFLLYCWKLDGIVIGYSKQISVLIVDDCVLQAVFAIIGDVDRSGKVDMMDIGLACLAYQSRPGDSNWNPYADVDPNGKIDMMDIGIICLNFQRQATY